MESCSSLNFSDGCAICLEPLAMYFGRGGVVRTPCEHLFHKKCLTGWIIGGIPGGCCPMCKEAMEVTDAVLVTSGDPLIKPAAFTLRKSEAGYVACPNIPGKSEYQTPTPSLSCGTPPTGNPSSVSGFSQTVWNPMWVPNPPLFMSTPPPATTFGELATHSNRQDFFTLRNSGSENVATPHVSEMSRDEAHTPGTWNKSCSIRPASFTLGNPGSGFVSSPIIPGGSRDQGSTLHISSSSYGTTFGSPTATASDEPSTSGMIQSLWNTWRDPKPPRSVSPPPFVEPENVPLMEDSHYQTPRPINRSIFANPSFEQSLGNPARFLNLPRNPSTPHQNSFVELTLSDEGNWKCNRQQSQI